MKAVTQNAELQTYSREEILAMSPVERFLFDTMYLALCFEKSFLENEPIEYTTHWPREIELGVFFQNFKAYVSWMGIDCKEAAHIYIFGCELYRVLGLGHGGLLGLRHVVVLRLRRRGRRSRRRRR